jgi:8-oxo-dGTP pyrophosphatase MutT (NUDIX family)
MSNMYPIPVVTFIALFDGAALLYKRSDQESNFPGLWAFPGGKVEFGETLLDAVVRELYEETTLTPAGPVAFLNSYSFGRSVGCTFALEVGSSSVKMEGGEEYLWVRRLEDFSSLTRVQGVDNQFLSAKALLDEPCSWSSIKRLNLLPADYLNR